MKPRGTQQSETATRASKHSTPGLARQSTREGPFAGECVGGKNQTIDTPACLPSFIHSTDPQSDVARARSWAAIYVQDFDAPCVLQFAWISALCCALHRSTSQVIHRSGSYNNDNDSSPNTLSLSHSLSLLLARRKKKERSIVCVGIVPINSRTRVFCFWCSAAVAIRENRRAPTLGISAERRSHKTRTRHAQTQFLSAGRTTLNHCCCAVTHKSVWQTRRQGTRNRIRFDV